MKKSKKSPVSHKSLKPKKKKKKNAAAITPNVQKVPEFPKGTKVVVFIKVKESFKKKILMLKLRYTLIVTAGSALYMIGLFLPFVYRDDGLSHFRGIEIFSFGGIHLSVMAFVCVLSIIGFIEEKNFAWVFLILIFLCMIEPNTQIVFVIYHVPINELFRIIGPGFFLVPIGFLTGMLGACLLLFHRKYFSK